MEMKLRTRKQGKVGVGAVCFTVLMAMGVPQISEAWTDAAPLAGDEERPVPCGGAGDVPTPFLNTNQKVELSEGELYTLIGKVRFSRGGVFFEVDLVEHPWLASAKRRLNPFYSLDGSPSFWRKFEGRKVRIVVEAKGSVRLNASNGEGEYSLSLQPVADPVVLGAVVKSPIQGTLPR